MLNTLHPNPAKQLGVGFFSLPSAKHRLKCLAGAGQELTLAQFVLKNADPPGSLFAATCSHMSC